MTQDDAETFAIPLAVSSELADQETHWRFEALMRQAALPNHYFNYQPLVDLQRRRGRFAELGSQMEQLAAIVSPQQKTLPLIAAADAYRAAADEQSELRALTAISFLNNLDSNHQQRFFELLLKTKPDELVRISSVWPSPVGQQAADYVVAHGTAALAHAVVLSRGKSRPPVWGKGYNALVGLYFAEPTPDVNNAFIAALNDDPIGVRVSKPIDRAQQLAGDTWFYYGSRYGEYLGVSKLGDPEDFLPAILEQSPCGSASGYSHACGTITRVPATRNARSPTMATLSSCHPIGRISTTNLQSPTTSKEIEARPWPSGSKHSPCCRSNSTARAFPKASGETSGALATSFVLGIFSPS